MHEPEADRRLPDYMVLSGAHALAKRIERFWQRKGYERVSVWTAPSNTADKAHYVVRSNMKCGLPPGPRRPPPPAAR